MSSPPLPPEEQKRLEELNSLNILDTPIEESFECITRLIKTVLQVPIAGVSLVDSERQWFKSEHGLGMCETDRRDAICSHTILQDDVLYVADTLSDERFADNPFVTGPPNIRFYAGCPVKSRGGQRIGTVCAIDTKPNNLTAQQIEALKDLAKMTEVELERRSFLSQQHRLMAEIEQAKRASLIDDLTRLYNRSGMCQVLNWQKALAKEMNTGFAVALGDVDHFKQVNDRYGHFVGDEMLKNIAKTLLSCTRDRDAVGRWGGEEFMIIINDDSANHLHRIADRFRHCVEKNCLQIDGKTLTCTITIGVKLVYPTSNMEIDALVDDADQALYHGKFLGRNRVYVAS